MATLAYEICLKTVYFVTPNYFLRIIFLTKYAKDKQSLKNSVRPIFVKMQKCYFSKYFFLAIQIFFIFAIKNDICGAGHRTK